MEKKRKKKKKPSCVDVERGCQPLGGSVVLVRPARAGLMKVPETQRKVPKMPVQASP